MDNTWLFISTLYCCSFVTYMILLHMWNSYGAITLRHQGPLTQICVNNLDNHAINGLSHVRCQAINQTKANLLSTVNWKSNYEMMTWNTTLVLFRIRSFNITRSIRAMNIEINTIIPRATQFSYNFLKDQSWEQDTVFASDLLKSRRNEIRG